MLKKISFVIPCYRSEKTLPLVIQEIEETMAQRPKLGLEIICVSDASPDGVYEVIKKLAAEKKYIKGIEFLKNFGQHAALMAGYRAATGDVIVSVDDDGQIPVDETFKLLDKLEEGYDIVWGTYEHKQHSWFRNFGSKVNQIMAQELIGQPTNIRITSFFVMTSQIAKNVCSYTKSYVYLAGLLLRLTNNIATVGVVHRERRYGDSGYTIKKLVSLWLNGFTAFSVKPLRGATILGVLSSLGSFLYIAYIIYKKIMFNIVPLGWSSLIASVFFCGGMILMVLGMIGEYVGRIYICINEAPQYVIRCKTEN